MTTQIIDDKELEQYGVELVSMMQFLELPESFIKSMAITLPDLEVEHVDALYASLKEATMEKLTVEVDPEYQAASDDIDRETMDEINKIISE